MTRFTYDSPARCVNFAITSYASNPVFYAESLGLVDPVQIGKAKFNLF